MLSYYSQTERINSLENELIQLSSPSYLGPSVLYNLTSVWVLQTPNIFCMKNVIRQEKWDKKMYLWACIQTLAEGFIPQKLVFRHKYYENVFFGGVKPSTYVDQRLEYPAPKLWSKYTTLHTPTMPQIHQLWLRSFEHIGKYFSRHKQPIRKRFDQSFYLITKTETW